MGSLHIFNELSEHITIKINSCYDYDDDITWCESKSHNDYDLWLITSGQILLEAAGRQYIARSGDVVFFYPGLPYTASSGSGSFSFIFLHFDYRIGNNSRILNDFNLSGIINGELIRKETYLFRKGFEKYKASASMSAMQLKGLLTLLLSRIMELCSEGIGIQGFPNDRNKETTKNLHFLAPVLSYIEHNISKPLRMSELAAAAGISEKYFITYFKASLGITPGQYIFQLKMNRARDYIYQRKFSYKEIAGLLGYPDQYAFSKAFKKYYNVPPSRFM